MKKILFRGLLVVTLGILSYTSIQQLQAQYVPPLPVGSQMLAEYVPPLPCAIVQ